MILPFQSGQIRTNTIYLYGYNESRVAAELESSEMQFIDKVPSPTTNEILRARMLIDGRWVEAASGETITVENPAKRRSIAEVPRGKAADVDLAVTAAAKAFEEWRRVAPRDRGRLLARIGDALEARAEDIARLISLETGNALRTQARPEAQSLAGMFRYFGGLAGELKGETVPLGEQVLSYTRREPYGVVGAIECVENCARFVRRKHHCVKSG
jgi:betaine-aldehyde dehydrogenase